MKIKEKQAWLGLIVGTGVHIPFFLYLARLHVVEPQAVWRSLCALIAGMLFCWDIQRHSSTKIFQVSVFYFWGGLSSLCCVLAYFMGPVCWAFSLAFWLRALLWRVAMPVWLVPSLLGFVAFPWDYVLGPLLDFQLCELTAFYAESLASKSGLNTLVSTEAANTIQGDGFILRVTPACAGIQTFVALQTLSLVLSMIFYARRFESILRFLVLVFVGGFVGNTMRIVLTCHVAYLFSDNFTYWKISHDTLGALTYIVVIYLAYCLERTWSKFGTKIRQGAL